MGALQTRAFVHAGGDYYLCPLGLVQLPADVLCRYLAPVWTEEQALTPIYRRLKGKPLSLTPMCLRDDERVKGLIRLLTIGLRVLTLLEFVVRRRLAQALDAYGFATRVWGVLAEGLR